MAQTDKQIEKNKKKCCCTGLHFTKNDVCIQSIRPFKVQNKPRTEEFETESDFCRSILASRTQSNAFEENNELFPKKDVESEFIGSNDFMDVLNDFAASFNIEE